MLSQNQIHQKNIGLKILDASNKIIDREEIQRANAYENIKKLEEGCLEINDEIIFDYEEFLRKNPQWWIKLGITDKEIESKLTRLY